MRELSVRSIGGALILAASGIAMACGGGGGSTKTNNPSAPTQIVPGSIGATIVLTSNGANPIDVRIEPTQRVRFINNDTRPREIQTNPHNFHTECPPNNIVILNPGQQVDTGIFTEVKACGYHDHLMDTNQKFWGTIRVGTNDDSKGPIYSKGW